MLPWYIFAVQWADGRLDNPYTTNLPSHEAATRFARLIIRELKERPEYRDPKLKMLVKDDNSEVIRVIPF